MNSILLRGLLGGVAMFLAGIITHVLLPLGEVGIQRLPAEDPVTAALRAVVPNRGLYYFPAPPPNATSDQQQQWQQRHRAGPVGLLVYQPQGGEPMPPRQLLGEFASNVAVALLAAWLLAQAAPASYAARVLFVAALGLLATLAINVSFWNWYAFPTDFTLAAIASEVIGFAAAGLVLAWPRP